MQEKSRPFRKTQRPERCDPAISRIGAHNVRSRTCWPGSRRRQASRWLDNFSLPVVKALVWDVTVVDTLAQSYVAATSQLAGSAADAAETRKQRKYEALEQQFIVQPIGFETMGSWGAGAKAFLTDVGNRVKQATGNQRAMEFLRQRVSIEIQRGNAASVMGTVENTKDWSSLFLLS